MKSDSNLSLPLTDGSLNQAQKIVKLIDESSTVQPRELAPCGRGENTPPVKPQITVVLNFE